MGCGCVAYAEGANTACSATLVSLAVLQVKAFSCSTAPPLPVPGEAALNFDQLGTACYT